MGVPTKDATHLAQTSASSSDIENGNIGMTYEVKRDLGRRHINMIAIAGMIVSETHLKPSLARTLTQTQSRAPGYSWHLARQSPLQDQSVLFSDSYAWV